MQTAGKSNTLILTNYNNGSNADTKTDQQQVHIFYLLYQLGKDWQVPTKREEVRIFSYFGQMQLDTGKKNLAKTINKLVNWVGWLRLSVNE